MKIYAAISAIMADVGAVEKGRKNEQQGYYFRGIDEVYAALHLLLAKHGVFTVPEILDDRTEERTTKNGSHLIYRIIKIKYTFYASDGSSVAATVIGEGMDSGDKATNKAMSVAHKYALIQVFAIPTKDEKDPEVDSHEVQPRIPPPPVETSPKYDGKNEEHADRLVKRLEGMQIPSNRWDDIGKWLQGKPMTIDNLDRAIAAVEKLT